MSRNDSKSRHLHVDVISEPKVRLRPVVVAPSIDQREHRRTTPTYRVLVPKRLNLHTTDWLTESSLTLLGGAIALSCGALMLLSAVASSGGRLLMLPSADGGAADLRPVMNHVLIAATEAQTAIYDK